VIMEEACRELVQFLQLTTRFEIKLTAIQNVLAITGTPDGQKLIFDNKKLLECILTLTKDSHPAVVNESYLCIINLSTYGRASEILLKNYEILPEFFKVICDGESPYSDKVCSIINNLTRGKDGAKVVAQCLADVYPDGSKVIKLAKLLEIFSKVEYNKSCSMDYLAAFFSNLTQLPEVRQFFLDQSKIRINQLFPFLTYKKSVKRRGGIAATIRNCCFEYESHDWLLSEDVDLLPHLLLPLAGAEEFDDDDNDRLPLDLQYLPSDKQREEDPDVRVILVEALTLLCATQSGRAYVKDKNTYVIMRELYRWETENDNTDVAETCEKLVQILISDEPEDGRENLLTCDIPEEHLKKLQSCG
uniref:Protein HGH1 homolog n=2 Tax=Ciona intestinalis TaxID=7719 RepID=H2XL93_CIOIN